MNMELVQIFGEAGCQGQLCVQTDDASHEIALSADQPVVAASVFKVLVAVAAEAAFAVGELDPTRRVHLPSTSRTPGPTGFSLFQDDIHISARDLVPAMLTISDNVATDALLELLTIDTCNQVATELGLASTVIVSNLAEMISSIAHDAGFADWNEFTVWQSRDVSPTERDDVDRRIRTAAALSPATATRTTARDMCNLLRAIWSDAAGPPAACQRVRSLMAQQLTRHRLASAFPSPARVAAKSGGLLGVIRNEIGVIRLPDGRHVYAAVFTEAGPATTEGRVNAAIGAAAAVAVHDLAR